MTHTEALRRLVEAVRDTLPAYSHWGATLVNSEAWTRLMDANTAARAALAQNRPLTCEDVGCQCAQAALGAGEENGMLDRARQRDRLREEVTDLRARPAHCEEDLKPYAMELGEQLRKNSELTARLADREALLQSYRDIRDDLVKRLAAVEAERDRFRQHALDYEATLGLADEKADRLVAALERYGRHAASCTCEERWARPDERLRLAVLGAVDEDYVRSIYPCTCGLDAARGGGRV